MKKIILLLIIFFSLSQYAAAFDWDIVNEDCSDINDWADHDYRTGVSEINSAGQFRFYSPTAGQDGNAINSNAAIRTRDLNFISYDTFTYEIKLYFELINNYRQSGRAGGFRIWIDTNYDDEWMEDYRGFEIKFHADGLYIGDVEVGGDLVTLGEWHIWRFEIDNTDANNPAMEVFLDNISVGTTENDYNYGFASIHTLNLYTSVGKPTQTIYVDFIKAGSGFAPVSPVGTYQDIGLRFRRGESASKIGVLPLEDTHNLRIQKGATTYGIPLVDVDDDLAGPIRIYDGNEIKALPRQ